MRRRIRPLAFSLLTCSLLACGGDDGDPSETSGAASSTGNADSGSTAGSSTDPGGGTSTAASEGTTGSEGGEATTTGTTGVADTSGSEASGTAGPIDGPPTNGAELLPWLEAGTYTDWAAEAETHPSAGPHFTAVRTFVNEALLGSLEGGGKDHPVGAAVVKELYGAGDELGGWAVLVKVAPGSTVDNWYWYESFDGTTYADETGNAGCGNCHAQGVDYILTTLPL